MNPNIEKAFHDYEALIAKENKPAAFYNGIYTRYENPVLTRDHIPPFWKFDLNEETNPLGLERLGVNAVMNSGAIKLNGQYCLVARVEGNDRKSFFAVARSNTLCRASALMITRSSCQTPPPRKRTSTICV